MSAAVAVTLSRADSDTPPCPGIRVTGQDDSMIKVPETPSETLPASRSAAVSGGQAAGASRTNITGRLAALAVPGPRPSPAAALPLWAGRKSRYSVTTATD